MIQIFVLSLAIAGAIASPFQGRIKAPQADEVCYDNYGCFSNDAPWSSALRPLAALPGRPEEVGTRHLLFTRTTRNEADAEELIPGKDALLEFSQYDGARSTVVIIHGWTDNSTSDWVVKTKNALLDKEDLNILVIDWAPGASQSYLKGVGNARLVGAQISMLLQFVIDKTATTAAKIHIIGHSLGAHIAAYVGNRVDNIARITALDPSQPYFEGTDPIVRIDATDAVFVEGIHTNTKSASLLEGFGVPSPIGNVDIYPNGGEAQPGCNDRIGRLVGTYLGLITMDFGGYFSDYACSHARATEYWTESLRTNDCGFVAYRCEDYKTFQTGSCYTTCQDGSCLVIGNEKERARALLPGQYFIHTDSQASFCLQPATMVSGVSVSQAKVDHGEVTVQFRRLDGITTEKFILAAGAINAEDNLTHQVEVPSAFLPTVDTILTATLHYTRKGLTPTLDPKTLSLQGLTVTFVDKELQLHTKKFYGATLEAGVDVIVGEEK
jgi:pancreatic triacylglycerol lipase